VVFNLKDPLHKFSSQTYEKQLRLHNRKSQYLKNNEIYHYTFQKSIYLIHAYGNISEGDLYHTQVTPQGDSLKTRITPKLATAVVHLIYKHSTFLGHRVIRVLPNATVAYRKGHNHT